MMAPSLKSKRKKKSIPMAVCESHKTPGLRLIEDGAVASSCVEEHQKDPERPDQTDCPAVKLDDAAKAEPKSSAESSGDEEMLSGEREEEQAFLVNLYKFMKDRHTPIERVPHLGFKQINLFKIYKVVEKLGAYELVTGRRLWKNVYDILGGSPGSTSAATCTRRHYERLVLPYVRHLKGEDDKPLPPVKPRKQYKIAKEPRGDKGDGAADKKPGKKEKNGDQVLPEKPSSDIVSAPKPTDCVEQNPPQEQSKGLLPFPNDQEPIESQSLEGCRCDGRAHGGSEPYKRLFSSFYFKGNHGIMSPLAKKKLLAQVSKAEALRCHGTHLSHCPEYKAARSREVPGSDPEASSNIQSIGHCYKVQKTVLEVDGPSSPAGSSCLPKASEGALKAPLTVLKDSQAHQKADIGGCGAPVSHGPSFFTGYFHAYKNDIMKPISCHPLRGPVGYLAGFKDFPESSCTYQQPGTDLLASHMSRKRPEEAEEQPENLCKKLCQSLPSWRGDGQQPSAFRASSSSSKRVVSPFPNAKAAWVPPVVSMARVSPQVSKNGGQLVSQSQVGSSAPASTQKSKQTLEEESFVHGKHPKAVSPFSKEDEAKDGLERGVSPDGQQGVAKPKAALPSSVFPAAPVPRVPDTYKGTMLRLPVNLSSSGEHLKGQSPSLIPSLSVSPFIIPAFPTPLLTASVVKPSDLCQAMDTNLVHYSTSYDNMLRHRLYPVSAWHSQSAYSTPHVPSLHRNTKL